MGIDEALTLRSLLPSRDWRVRADADPEAAIEALRAGTIELVLLGPGHCAEAVVGALVAAAGALPVLALSPDDDAGVAAMGCGAEDFLRWDALERAPLLSMLRKAAVRADRRCGSCALAEAFAHAPVAVALADPGFGIQWMNTAFALFHDLGDGALRRRSLLSCFPPEAVGALGAREGWSGVWRSDERDERWEQGSLTPIEDLDGGVSGYVATKRDVSERERNARALMLQEESHRRLVTHAPSVIYRARGEWWVETLSHHIEDLTGYSPAEFSAGLVRWPDVVHPEDCERVLGEAEGMNAGLTELTQEYRLVHRDGRVVWVQDRKEAVFGLDGSLAYVHGVVQDIDARKRAELALERQARFLQTLIDAIPSPLFFKDRQRRFISCNKAFERLVGTLRSELEGRRAEELWPSSQAEEVERVDRGLLESGGTVVYDTRIDDELRRHLPNLPPEVRDLTYLKSTFEGVDGEVGGLIAVIVDSSEKLRVAEESLLARDEAERAAARKAALLANASHEIRTPLNAVIGMSQLLAGSPLSDEQRRRVHRIQEAGEGLLHLLHDLLDVARIEAGAVSVERIPFPLDDLLASVVELMAAPAHTAGLRLWFERDPRLPERILGDPRRLRQVLLNLLGNALKFTPEGEIVVQARREDDELGGPWLQLSVQDSGVGMAPDQVHGLFERFERGEVAGGDGIEGAGLGLAICQQLVGLMGGRIEVQTTPGVGSTFAVLLPLEVPVVVPELSPLVEAPEPGRSVVHREHQLRELSRLLDEHDTEALDRVERFLASGPPPTQRGLLEDVQRHLRGYDFPAARASLALLVGDAASGGAL